MERNCISMKVWFEQRTVDLGKVVITNCELPCNLYSKLPEEFQKLAMVNFNRDSEFYGESDIEDLDATGFACTPLRPIKEIMVNEVYRRLWHDMLQKAGFDPKVK